MTSRAMEHVRRLAETIGPRGSTTPGEARAADYVSAELEGFGLTPERQPFRSARSAWWPLAFFWGLILVSCIAFLWGGRVGAIGALGCGLVAFVSVLLELLFFPNPLRWLLPTGPSQNVFAHIEPRGEARERVVLVAHLDTHRTPLVFSSDAWVRLFERLVPVGMACTGLLLVLFALGVAFPWASLRFVALGPLIVVVGMLALTVQADCTPYTAGANDNASGVGVILSLAERLAAVPRSVTSVHVLFSGCEEVGCYGAFAFARKHAKRLGGAAWISVDTMASEGGVPVYLEQESFLATTRSDPQLLDLAGRIATRRPELGARAISMKGAYTEGVVGKRYGMRVLTLGSQRVDGSLGEWHRPTDVIEHVGTHCLGRSESLLWELIRAIDAG